MLRAAALRASRRVQAIALQQRAFGEKAVAAELALGEKGVAAELDWDALAELVHTDEAKRELTALRSTYAEFKQRLEELTKEPEPIDWAAYKKVLDPALVDEFKIAFDNIEWPEYEGTDVEDASSKFAILIKEAEEMVAHSEQRCKEIELELENIERDKARLATVTIDEMMASDPKLAEEVDKEIAEKYFMP